MSFLRMSRILASGLVAGALIAAGPAVSAAPSSGTALVRLSLPAPSGPHVVGTVALRLTDRSRPDPWVASQPYRDLMISLFYPARDAGKYPVAPQMTPGAAKHFDASLADVHQGWGLAPGKVDWGATATHSHVGAPAEPGSHPVVLYSPGAGDPRTLGTTLAEDLASRGYVVVTIDHPSDASEVEFPDGRVVPFGLPLDGDIIATLKKVLAVRVADTRFMLDRLGDLPGAPAGTLDLRHIGMVGQSAGGFTALQTMHDDPRILAAADLDGTVGFDQNDGGPGLSPLAEDGLKRPYLLMGSQASDHHVVRSWEELWSNSTGWRRDLHLRGSAHGSYTDLESLVPQLVAKAGLSAQAAQEDTGWIDPDRSVAAVRAYLAAFFDRELRGRDSGLLDGPSARYPEVGFIG
jgi:dienelactone hydrolase